MKPNAGPEQSLRIEVPLAFCPLFGETQRETNATRGSDNCNPTLEGGGWKPNGTKLAPEEWRNGALIQKVGGTFFKLVWGEQFGFGVRTSPTSPNATGRSHEANDPGCPQGCLFDIIGPLPAPAPVACAQLPTAPQPTRRRRRTCRARPRTSRSSGSCSRGRRRSACPSSRPTTPTSRTTRAASRWRRWTPSTAASSGRAAASSRSAGRCACCWGGCCYARPQPRPSLRPWPTWQCRSSSLLRGLP